MPDAYRVKDKYEHLLLSLPGVVGVSCDGSKIIVYVESIEYSYRIPGELEGVPVEVRVVGKPRTY